MLRVPVSRGSAAGLGHQLRLSVAPRRTAVTFSPTFDEANLTGEERRNVRRSPAKPAFAEAGQTVPVKRGSATGLGQQLRLSVAPRRTVITASLIFAEVNLTGEERRNVGRPPAKPAFAEAGQTVPVCGL